MLDKSTYLIVTGNFRTNLFLLLFLSFIFFSANGQKYALKSYSINEGLPHASVNVLFQDTRGLIWIGTEGGGVCQFDGYTFYTLSEKDGLLSNNVNSILEDSIGRIWYGTSRGLCYFDGNTIINLAKTIYAGNINKLFIDKLGILWVLTSKDGALRVDIRHEKLLQNEFNSGSKRDKTFHDIAEDSFGRFWLVSDSGMIIIDPNQQWEQIELGIKLIIPPNQIGNIAKSINNEMWISTKSMGVFLLNYDSLSCSEKRSYNSYFDDIDDNILCLSLDRSSNVWLGTDDNGVVNIDYPFIRKLTVENGLKSNDITDILEDREGNIWIGTQNHGVIMFMGWHFVHYDKGTGFPDNSVNCISQDKEGNYWCGGSNGLYRLRRKNDQLQVFNVLLPERYSHVEINSILFRNESDMFFGTKRRGLIRIKDNDISLIDASEGLPGNYISYLYSDCDTSLWVGMQTGFAQIINDSIINHTGRSEAFREGINCITGNKNGTLWVGTNQGLVRVFNESFTLMNEDHGLHHKRIISLFADDNFNLWIGTMGGGLYHYKTALKNEEISHPSQILSDRDLVSANINSIGQLNDSVLIIGTDKGANRIFFTNDSAVSIISVYSYDNSNGFINLECNQNALFVDDYNYTWFGTKSGLTCYDPQRERKTSETPRIYFTGMEVNFEAIKWQSEKHKENEWFSFPDELKLKHNQNYVNFIFSGIYFSEELLYQTFMEGLDKDWDIPGSQRHRNFSKLPPGKYNFRTRSITSSGLVSHEKSFPFLIKPPFWKTWWFYSIIVLLGVYAIIWYIRYRERKLKYAKAVLEQTVQIRTEEIRDQKLRIEKQKLELTDSIHYAKKIQEAILPKKRIIENYFKEYFILFLPRDIVSGDFYWFGEYDGKLIFSVVDCTGHGVPGAFMSMLGIRLLNEIVLERKITAPDEILNQLRSGVIQALQQDDEAAETRDGMDMALCMYDPQNEILQFAGAYNSLWLIRDNELITYKGDRMPVGYHIRKEKFTVTGVECKKGDQVYLFSDGLPDQFGGPEIKKYKPKRLREVISANAQLKMEDQKKALLFDFSEWKGEEEQVDDVSFLGIRF